MTPQPLHNLDKRLRKALIKSLQEKAHSKDWPPQFILSDQGKRISDAINMVRDKTCEQMRKHAAFSSKQEFDEFLLEIMITLGADPDFSDQQPIIESTLEAVHQHCVDLLAQQDENADDESGEKPGLGKSYHERVRSVIRLEITSLYRKDSEEERFAAAQFQDYFRQYPAEFQSRSQVEEYFTAAIDFISTGYGPGRRKIFEYMKKQALSVEERAPRVKRSATVSIPDANPPELKKKSPESTRSPNGDLRKRVRQIREQTIASLDAIHFDRIARSSIPFTLCQSEARLMDNNGRIIPDDFRMILESELSGFQRFGSEKDVDAFIRMVFSQHLKGFHFDVSGISLFLGSSIREKFESEMREVKSGPSIATKTLEVVDSAHHVVAPVDIEASHQQPSRNDFSEREPTLGETHEIELPREDKNEEKDSLDKDPEKLAVVEASSTDVSDSEPLDITPASAALVIPASAIMAFKRGASLTEQQKMNMQKELPLAFQRGMDALSRFQEWPEVPENDRKPSFELMNAQAAERFQMRADQLVLKLYRTVDQHVMYFKLTRIPDYLFLEITRFLHRILLKSVDAGAKTAELLVNYRRGAATFPTSHLYDIALSTLEKIADEMIKSESPDALKNGKEITGLIHREMPSILRQCLSALFGEDIVAFEKDVSLAVKRGFSSFSDVSSGFNSSSVTYSVYYSLCAFASTLTGYSQKDPDSGVFPLLEDIQSHEKIKYGRMVSEDSRASFHDMGFYNHHLFTHGDWSDGMVGQIIAPYETQLSESLQDPEDLSKARRFIGESFFIFAGIIGCYFSETRRQRLNGITAMSRFYGENPKRLDFETFDKALVVILQRLVSAFKNGVPDRVVSVRILNSILPDVLELFFSTLFNDPEGAFTTRKALREYAQAIDIRSERTNVSSASLHEHLIAASHLSVQLFVNSAIMNEARVISECSNAFLMVCNEGFMGPVDVFLQVRERMYKDPSLGLTVPSSYDEVLVHRQIISLQINHQLLLTHDLPSIFSAERLSIVLRALDHVFEITQDGLKKVLEEVNFPIPALSPVVFFEFNHVILVRSCIHLENMREETDDALFLQKFWAKFRDEILPNSLREFLVSF